MLPVARAGLEQAQLPGLLYASGLAAVASVLSLVPAGGRVVLPRHSYQGSLALAADLESRGMLTVRTVDVADTEDVVVALDDADLLWLESPTNPMLEVADLPALLAAARASGNVIDSRRMAGPITASSTASTTWSRGPR